MLNIFTFGLLVHHHQIFKSFPIFGPFLGSGPFVTLETSLNKLKSPWVKNAQCQLKMHSGHSQWFTGVVHGSKIF